MSETKTSENVTPSLQGSKAVELLNIKQAAKIIGIQYRQLLEAVNAGEVPHYRLRKSRRLVKTSEVIAVMQHQAHTSFGEKQ